MPRVFVSAEQIPEITGSDVHHIRDVLRLKAGDPLELLDGTGKIYGAKISKVEKDKIICEILDSRTPDSEPGTRVTLAQALPKARKMDFIVEKCVELGVYRIVPMATERSVAKSAKIDRWEKIAKAAALQSGRSIIPEITGLMTFNEVLKLRGKYDQALIPWELEKVRSLKKHFTDNRISGSPDILIAIGPEGGFSQKEIELAKKAGFASISLGKRILRTETAGMAVLSAIMYELE